MQSNKKKGGTTAHYYNDRSISAGSIIRTTVRHEEYILVREYHLGMRHETQLLLSNVVIPSPLESLSSSSLKAYQQSTEVRPAERKSIPTNSFAQLQIIWKGNPLETRSLMRITRVGELAITDAQRYACARAAVAGAVSGFLTASRRVDATNRTL
jgi:hypothetical protein